MLGLYDDDGELHVVGHTSGFTAKQKRELVATLAPYETGDRGSGDPSRWTAGRELEWVTLRPELVVEVTPFVAAADGAQDWLQGGEGVIAKQLDAPYRPGERKGMVKVKRVRTIDCVVMGWRPGKHEGTVGSLILGLYDKGKLRPVGHTSGLKAKEKKELVKTLKPYETGGRGSGDPSRWDSGRELEWYELRPELVVEVTYDHTSGGRIRHGSKIIRWREDKKPRECKFDQLT